MRAALLLCCAVVVAVCCDASLLMSAPLAPPSTTSLNDQFGASVATSGSLVAIGAPQCLMWLNSTILQPNLARITGNGYVVVYVCSDTTDSCTLAANITAYTAYPSDANALDACFGYSVALVSGSYLVVGAPNYGPKGTTPGGNGALYQFYLQVNGTTVTPVLQYSVLDTTASSYYAIGYSISATITYTGQVHVAAGMPFYCTAGTSACFTWAYPTYTRGGFVSTYCPSTTASTSTCTNAYMLTVTSSPGAAGMSIYMPWTPSVVLYQYFCYVGTYNSYAGVSYPAYWNKMYVGNAGSGPVDEGDTYQFSLGYISSNEIIMNNVFSCSAVLISKNRLPQPLHRRDLPVCCDWRCGKRRSLCVPVLPSYRCCRPGLLHLRPLHAGDLTRIRFLWLQHKGRCQ